ncbi:ABC transporter permease [Streptomyces armeniacus]|uniref:Transport permease protein n=1 Tax=Streptomyces armeniacus TaxID=83291 RepID=A0A345XPT8_9ACTN|nr:ABC transporter permease [Streptomyces armeniacus]AXK33654.1 ABC transporter permease [Streptomyces armeniacus]
MSSTTPNAGSPGLTDILTLTGRHLRHLKRTPEKIISTALTPVAMVVILGYLFASVLSIPGGVAYKSYVMAGVYTQVGLTCVGITALGVATDMNKGLIDRFRSLPMGRPAVLVSHTAADMVPAMISMVTVTAVGLLVGWRTDSDPLSIMLGFVLLLSFCYAMLWLGALLGLVIRNVEAINGISALVIVLFSFLSSAFMPLHKLPDGLRIVVEWNPASSLSAAVRELWGNQPNLGEPSFAVANALPIATGSIALMILVLVPMSLRLFRLR